MTNFEYYDTLDNAIKVYEKLSGDSVYNVHEGVSAGRFLKWLYKDKDFGTEKVVTERCDSYDKSYENSSAEKSESKQTSPNIASIISKLISLANSKTLSVKEVGLEIEKIVTALQKLDCIPNMNYQGLYDEAREMAYVLKKIEQETKDCARCKGDCQGAYSTDAYLKNICEILYSSCGYHFDKKYV